MHALFTNGRGKEPSSSNKILRKRKLNKNHWSLVTLQAVPKIQLIIVIVI